MTTTPDVGASVSRPNDDGGSVTIEPDVGASREPAGEPEPERQGDSRAKAADIKSLGDLIALAYEQQGKRFSVPSNVLETIARQPDRASYDQVAQDQSRELLVELAASDPLLLVPPRLLVAVEDSGAPAPLRRRLAVLISAALRRHPVFDDDDLQLTLTAAPRDQERTFETLDAAATRVSSERLGIGSRDLKQSERERLRANAVTTLAMILAIRDRWPLDRFVLCLEVHLWRRARQAGSREPRALLADSRTPDALAVVAEVFAAQARRAEARVTETEAYAQQASRRAFDAEAQLEDRDSQLTERSNEIEQRLNEIKDLQATLTSERKNRVVDRSHHVDDYEALRTRLVRMLDRQTDLLADGLHALRNGSTGVTEEYLERSVDALAKERDQLKEEGAGTG